MLAVNNFKTDVLPDTRPPLEQLSRMSLFYLMWANKIPDVRDDMPKERLVKIAELNADKLIITREDGSWAFNGVNAYKTLTGSVAIVRPQEHIDSYKEKPVKAQSSSATKAPVVEEKDEKIL